MFIFVEGTDDDRFVEKVVQQMLGNKFTWIKTYQYAQKKRSKVRNFIKSIISITSMDADYIFLTDINSFPCITAKKEKTRREYAGVNDTKIIVVVKEIESWYLAGLDNATIEKLKLAPYDTTDEITKEEFDSRKPRKFTSRIDFMQELLKDYSIEVAKSRNASFSYFAEHS